MQGFNMGRYMPPDDTGRPTFNTNTHPLGSRARRLRSKGTLIVRFEMPFAIWCTHCRPEEIIGQGVRFNAEKKKVGNYYSTPIYSFRIKHTLCGGWIEIRTDPKNTAYVVADGGRKRDFGVDEEGRPVGEISLGIERESKAIPDDPFAKIEGKLEDKRAVDESKSRVLELQQRQDRDWDDPYEVSRRLRRGFRAERKILEREEGRKEALREKMSLGIEIVDESEEDKLRAGMVEFKGGGHATTAGASRTSTKPMFESASASSSHPYNSTATIEKKGNKTGKRKLADLVAERKALFRSELTGNTRAAIDPFLNGAGDSGNASTWEPEIKRRKTPGKKANGRSIGHSEDAQAGGGISVPGGSVETAKSTQDTSDSVALVDYGSDSE